MAGNGSHGNRRPGQRAELERKEPCEDASEAKSELPQILRRLEQAELGAWHAAGTARRGIAHAIARGDAAALARSVEDLVVIRMDLKRLEDFRAGTEGAAAGPGAGGAAEEATSDGGNVEESDEDAGEDNATKHILRHQHVFLERNPWFDLLSDDVAESTVRAFARMLRLEGLEPDETGFWIELEQRIHAHLQGRAEGSVAVN